jgi:phage baseplate assembly protein gpV
VLVDSPDSRFTGKVTVEGPLAYKAGMSGTGGATISGDVTADGVSLKGHVHDDPQGGKVSPPS